MKNVNDPSKVLEEIKKEGFTRILKVPYTMKYVYGNKDVKIENECFYVFFHKQYGLLLVCDTYGNQKEITTAHMYYNWIPNDPEKCPVLLNSGGEEEGIWVGDYSWTSHENIAMEIRKAIKDFTKHGKLLAKWKFSRDAYLLHGQDKQKIDPSMKSFDGAKVTRITDRINKNRKGKFPKYVQVAIKGQPRQKSFKKTKA